MQSTLTLMVQKRSGCSCLQRIDLVDVIVNEALGMIGMVLLSLGELGSQMQRFEMMVVPIDIALQLPGISLVGGDRVARLPIPG
jgi:hypothetical protein